MFFDSVDLTKLLIAIAVGGLIGAEREFRDKAAGFRTIIFICVGATLFTIFSYKLGGAEDPVRIAANVVTGIGFLGAGAILREGGRVVGLTTAATIWLVAALGMGVGGGHFAFVGAAVAAILVVLWIFPILEGIIDRARETRTYEVVCHLDPTKFEKLEQAFRELGLKVQDHRQTKTGDRMTCVWEARGSVREHDRVTESLLKDPDVFEFRF